MEGRIIEGNEGLLCSAPAKVVDKPSWQAPHQTGLFPVSIEWEPPFTMLVDLIGHGDHQAGTDVSASLTAWGNWQPALAPVRGPTVLDALIGSLGSRSTTEKVRRQQASFTDDSNHVCCSPSLEARTLYWRWHSCGVCFCIEHVTSAHAFRHSASTWPNKTSWQNRYHRQLAFAML